MIIIDGGEPELCRVSERVGCVHDDIHYACASLRCARVVRYIESVKTVCGVSGKAYVKKDGDTDKEAEVRRSGRVGGDGVQLGDGARCIYRRGITGKT